METLIQKVVKVIRSTKRNSDNKIYIPSLCVETLFSDDPDIEIIREKAEKVIKLSNEAEERNDRKFLNRDFETDIWFTL